MTAGAEERQGWGVLLRPEWLPALAVLLGGILLHSMNVLMLATVLPTIVGELGGASLMSLPSTAFLASSIVAATCAGLPARRPVRTCVTSWLGLDSAPRRNAPIYNLISGTANIGRACVHAAGLRW